MYYSKPRKETVKKYTMYLKSLIIKIEKYGDVFSAPKFVEENRLPHKFIPVCEELQYISSARNGQSKVLHPILKAECITEFHGLAIAEASLRYNINHSETYDKSGNHIVTSKECRSRLSDFSIKELLSELRRRGVLSSL